ncbi:hypothetical protein LSAT2_032288 [Lamellibrachia satsuma]|nr:hypothetical protein LSAT2_032288 [Lamellibrachia satsuma]
MDEEYKMGDAVLDRHWSTEEFLYNYKAALPGSRRAFQGKVEDLTTEATAYGLEEPNHNYQKDPLVTAIEATKPRVLPSKPLSDESVPALKPPYWDGDWEGLSIVPMLKKIKAPGIGKPGYMQSVCKLLRQIRNCDAHDLDSDIRTELGDSRYEYFNGNFPQLFMEVYGVIKSNDTWIRERKMREFFPKTEGEYEDDDDVEEKDDEVEGVIVFVLIIVIMITLIVIIFVIIIIITKTGEYEDDDDVEEKDDEVEGVIVFVLIIVIMITLIVIIFVIIIIIISKTA